MEAVRRVVSKHVAEGRLKGAVLLATRSLAGPHILKVEEGFSEDSLFRMYSQSKVVTGVALLILLERGLVRSIDDDVATYIPAFRQLKVLLDDHAEPGSGAWCKRPDRPVTLRMLLTHTSGIDYQGLPEYDAVATLPALGRAAQMYAELARDAEHRHIQTLEEWVDRLAQIPISAEPGTKWQYGFGIDVIGRVVEVVSGKSLKDFLQQEIFDPLEMRETAFSTPTGLERKLVPFFRAGNKDAATGVRSLTVVDGAGDEPDGSDMPCSYTAGRHSRIYSGGGGLEMIRGGLVSSIADWSRFALMLLGEGSLNGVQILKPETLRFAIQDHLAAATEGRVSHIEPLMDTGRKSSFCLLHQLTADGTYGWGGMAGTTFYVHPRQNLVYLFMTSRWTDPTVAKIWVEVDSAFKAALQGSRL